MTLTEIVATVVARVYTVVAMAPLLTHACVLTVVAAQTNLYIVVERDY